MEGERIDVVCFGGGDWWYHNRAHIDMQLMRRFALTGRVLYVNSIVVQKTRLGKSGGLMKKIFRESKSIMRGLRKTDAGFWVYSPVSLPFHHIHWAREANERLVRWQLKFVMSILKITVDICVYSS